MVVPMTSAAKIFMDCAGMCEPPGVDRCGAKKGRTDRSAGKRNRHDSSPRADAKAQFVRAAADEYAMDPQSGGERRIVTRRPTEGRLGWLAPFTRSWRERRREKNLPAIAIVEDLSLTGA